MRASVRLMILSATSSGAVACVAQLAPNLSAQGKAVSVYSSHAEVPPGCAALGELSVVDGNTESSKGYMYQGTRDRALVRLRNASAARGGNAVVIEDEGDVVVLDGPEVGKYYINGQALQCDAAVRPNSAVSPTHSVVTALAQGSKRLAARAQG